MIFPGYFWQPSNFRAVFGWQTRAASSFTQIGVLEEN